MSGKSDLKSEEKMSEVEWSEVNWGGPLVFGTHTPRVGFATYYVFAKEKLGLSEEEAWNYARMEYKRNEFFFETCRNAGNMTVRILYSIPLLVLVTCLAIGFVRTTRWLFYLPAVVALFFWANQRKWPSFWVPILYWFKPLSKGTNENTDEIELLDWRSYFRQPSRFRKATLHMMIKACYGCAQPFPAGVICRTLVFHLLYWGIFAVLSRFAWK